MVGSTSIGDSHTRSGIRRDGRIGQTSDDGLKTVQEDETGRGGRGKRRKRREAGSRRHHRDIRTGRVEGDGWVRFIGRAKRDTKIQTIVVASPAKQVPIRAVFILLDSSRETRGSGSTMRRTVRGRNTPPRRGRGSRRSRSRRAIGGRSRGCRRPMNQFQVEIFKQRAVGGHVPGLFSAMTDRADARTGEGPVPACLDGFDQEQRDLFKWTRPFLARFVDGNSRCAGAALPWRLCPGVDQLKLIMVFTSATTKSTVTASKSL